MFKHKFNKKFTFLAFVLAFSALLWSSLNQALAADVVLPPPQTQGGAGLFDTLKKRSSLSGGDFSPLAEVSLEELSTVLWAASGLNRGQKGWTVPMARGLPPYATIFVAGNQGLFRYDWVEHKLVEISGENVKDQLGGQSFVKKAFYVLIFVSEKSVFAQAKSDHHGRERYGHGPGEEPRGGEDKAFVGKVSDANQGQERPEGRGPDGREPEGRGPRLDRFDAFVHVLVGAMTQDAYLAAASLGLGARYIHQMKTSNIEKLVPIAPGDYPVALMMLGK